MELIWLSFSSESLRELAVMSAAAALSLVPLGSVSDSEPSPLSFQTDVRWNLPKRSW